MPARLKRFEFVYQRGPIYFVTACTARRRSLLANKFVHDAFRVFAESASDHGTWIGAYVLMSDHMHFFAAFDDEHQTLSIWMKSLKGTLSSRFRATDLRPPFWQKGFFDHVLRSSESYAEKWHYVRENPVRAGLASNWEDWPYRGEIFNLEFRNDPV
jgi:putative transposase